MKGMIVGVLAVLMACSVLGVSVDEECRQYGFDFGYAKYELDESHWELGSMFNESYVEVEGDAQEMDWESTMHVAGVLRKSATDTSVLDGGMQGTVYGWEDMKPNGRVIVHDISHLTFCGRGGTGSSSGGGTHGVPEFSTVTLALAVVATALGLVIFRRN